MRRFTAFWLVSLTALASAIAQATAQTTVSGRVQTQAGNPIAGATVELPRLKASATTTDYGTYRLVVPDTALASKPESLQVRAIGYHPLSALLSISRGRNIRDVTLTQAVVELNRVVVTGTTVGAQTLKAQGAVVASLDAATIAREAPVSNVAQLLGSRTPGVSLAQSSGTTGTSQIIRIRGTTSISLTNQPLIYIDGVLADGKNSSGANGSNGVNTGGQAVSRLNDINPDDIQSIEVVKGPAAGTLYGADAAAGVIQIITKKGRLNSDRFTQEVSAEGDHITSPWTPPPNYGQCSAALVGPTSLNPLCRGQTAGTWVSDNPFSRAGGFRDGTNSVVNWSGRGGGTTFNYYLSASGANETGLFVSNYAKRQTARANLEWTPSERWLFTATAGLARSIVRLPENDNTGLGIFQSAELGSPLTRVDDASATTTTANGWTAGGRSLDGLNQIMNYYNTVRNTPTLTIKYTPWSWLTNRLTVGADFSNSTNHQLFPKNARNWYTTALNQGQITEDRLSSNIYTIDYQAGIHSSLSASRHIVSDLAVGFQYNDTQLNDLGGTGQNFVLNSAATVRGSASQSFFGSATDARSIGAFVQEQLAFSDRVFLQLGLRRDENSSFGDAQTPFYLPKVSLSYVMSEAPWWQRSPLSFINTLKLRGAWGRSGRAPAPGSSLQTYDPVPYLVGSGELPGVLLRNPGNAAIRPERSDEYEGGFDLGAWNDRVGLAFTAFKKLTSDLLLARPIAPSLGYAATATGYPLTNIGGVQNTGVEVTLRATPVLATNFGWDIQASIATANNRVTNLAGLSVISGPIREAVGTPIASFYEQKPVSYDLTNNRVTITDTAVFIAGPTPAIDGGITSTMTFLRNFRLSALLDGKGRFSVWNLNDDFRERGAGNSINNVPGTLSPTEYLRRFGPFVTQSGKVVPRGLGGGAGTEAYFQDGTFLRLREVSLNWSLPSTLIAKFRASGGSLMVGGRNLHLWTKYTGADPELQRDPANELYRLEFFSMPLERRFVSRINLAY